MTEFRSWRSYFTFAESVCVTRRYILAPDARAFLETLVTTAPSRVESLEAEEIFWRAQRGCDFAPYHQGGVYIDDLPTPFQPERMTPLPRRAVEGRANPKGIPYLYGASHLETAVAEVRPWIGAMVSVACFRLQRGVRLVNFTNVAQRQVLHMNEPSPAEREAAVWGDIDRAFARPVTPADDEASYAPTQIIAEAIRNAGFDGIAYRSSLGPGHNIALFDPSLARLESCAVRRVTSVSIQSEYDGSPMASYAVSIKQ
jgi:RES domain-containing protein